MYHLHTMTVPKASPQYYKKGYGTMKCPNCTKELRDDANFCTGCGKPIPRCPTCGKVLQKRARFCTDDGTPIPDEINALLPDTPGDASSVGRTHATGSVTKSNKSQNKKSKGAKPIIIIAVIAVIAILLITVAMIWMGKDHPGSSEIPNEHTSSQDTPPQEDEPEVESTPESSTEAIPETAPIQETSPTLRMPNCVGEYFNDVANTITSMNCTPSFEHVFSDDVELGYIMEQSIPADSILPEGSTVTFIVSKGPDVSPSGYDQKVVVTASSGSSYGTLALYNWENGEWVSEFTCDATVGKNGIGSDYGEGKGKSPQGIFKLGVALSANSISNTTWPYYRVTSDTCVVDDPESRYYNTLQNISTLPSGVSYDPIGNTLVKGNSNVCIYIEHNGSGRSEENVVSGKGSVITICGRSAAIAPTAGCIDISSSDMNTLIRLLEYDKNPHIEIGTP